MNKINTTKHIEIGLNNDGETFWANVLELELLQMAVPQTIRDVYAHRFVVTTELDAEAVRAWCATMPGWDENPLVFMEV